MPEEENESVRIARCPEHGLHGERTECFVCGRPVEQVPMVPARLLAREQIKCDSAAEVLADVLVDYDVPTRQIVGEFLRLMADPAYARPDPHREALERIAYHEPQHDERAEAMRQIAREALGV